MGPGTIAIAADFADDLPVVRRSELMAAERWWRGWLTRTIGAAFPFGFIAWGLWPELRLIALLSIGTWIYVVAGDFLARALPRAVRAYADGRYAVAERALRRLAPGGRRRAVLRYRIATAHARGDLQGALEGSAQLLDDIARTSTATASEAWEARACRIWLLLEHGDIHLAERELAQLPSPNGVHRFECIELELALAVEYAADRIPSAELLARAEVALTGVQDAPDLGRRLSLAITLVRWGWQRRGDGHRSRRWRAVLGCVGDRDRVQARMKGLRSASTRDQTPYRRALASPRHDEPELA